MTPLKALTIGSAMIDIITILADEDVERITFHNATTSFLLLEPGRKIEARSITIHVGGGAVNVGVALKRLGAEVDVLAKLGDDINGERIRRNFRAEGLGESRLLVSPDQPTGAAVMIAAHDRDAAIYTQRGANIDLHPDEVEAIDMGAYGLLYVSPLSKGSAECFAPAVARAKTAGAFTVATPGIRQITTRSPELLAVLDRLDLLVMNASEAAALVPPAMAYLAQCPVPLRGKARGDAAKPRALARGLKVADEAIPLEWLASALSGLGLKYFAMTDAGEGAYLSDGGSILHCPALPVEAVGTAGAGDAFGATLAHGLAEGLAPERALRRAAANAAAVVAFADTQSGLADARRLDAMIEAPGEPGLTRWPL
jgi:sugar/nucleoside kinase (ribokinase family)